MRQVNGVKQTFVGRQSKFLALEFPLCILYFSRIGKKEHVLRLCRTFIKQYYPFSKQKLHRYLIF